MSGHGDIKSEVRGYMIVFGALLVGTVITVGASYLHLSLVAAVTLALIIATVKAALVVCYFMHLISERQLIYIVLIFTVIFFSGLLSLPVYQYHDVQFGGQHTNETMAASAPQAAAHGSQH